MMSRISRNLHPVLRPNYNRGSTHYIPSETHSAWTAQNSHKATYSSRGPSPSPPPTPVADSRSASEDGLFALFIPTSSTGDTSGGDTKANTKPSHTGSKVSPAVSNSRFELPPGDHPTFKSGSGCYYEAHREGNVKSFHGYEFHGPDHFDYPDSLTPSDDHAYSDAYSYSPTEPGCSEYGLSEPYDSDSDQPESTYDDDDDGPGPEEDDHG